ncbi:10040_t:CDS:1, partial [Gigaspora margarita]
MSFEKFGFNIIQSSSSSASANNASTSRQDLLTHIGSLQDTVTAVQSSLVNLERKTKEFSNDKSGCPGCTFLRSKLNDAHTELKKRKSQKEMVKKIQDLEKRARELEKENPRL